MPRQLIPINLFDIEANLQHKKLGKTTMKTEEELDALAPEQYGIRKSKSADIQALNNRLLYYLKIIKESWQQETIMILFLTTI